MTLWNVYMAAHENKCRGDRLLFGCLTKFVNTHRRTLIDDRLMCNFTCHLATLEEHSLITTDQMTQLIHLVVEPTET